MPLAGSWRAIARLIIEQTNYPLHVIDNYKVDREEALRVAKVVSGLSSQSLEKVRVISRKRAETLPYAAAALRVILETVGPSEVVFSGFGMREGRLLQCLPKPCGRKILSSKGVAAWPTRRVASPFRARKFSTGCNLFFRVNNQSRREAAWPLVFSPTSGGRNIPITRPNTPSTAF